VAGLTGRDPGHGWQQVVEVTGRDPATAGSKSLINIHDTHARPAAWIDHTSRSHSPG